MKFVKLEKFTKTFHESFGQKVHVLNESNIQINENEKIGVLGLNGQGKTTLCRILGGSEPLSSGRRTVSGTISWPIGIFSSVVPSLTGRQNINMICNLYDLNRDELVEIVAGNAGIRDFIDYRVETYSSGMRAKLVFFLALAIKFDFYIFDEITSVGDYKFKSRAEEYFDYIRNSSGIILCSHNSALIKRHVEYCYIVNDKTISEKLPVDDAIEIYEAF